MRKMELSCLLGIERCFPQKKVSLMTYKSSVIIQASLAKATFGLLLFFRVYGPRPSIDQYPSLFMIRLAPRTGKTNQILRCDWLPERAGWSFLARSELPCCVPQEKFPQKPYNESFIDQACSVNMAGYWPRLFFCQFMDP